MPGRAKSKLESSILLVGTCTTRTKPKPNPDGKTMGRIACWMLVCIATFNNNNYQRKNKHMLKSNLQFPIKKLGVLYRKTLKAPISRINVIPLEAAHKFHERKRSFGSHRWGSRHYRC